MIIRVIGAATSLKKKKKVLFVVLIPYPTMFKFKINYHNDLAKVRVKWKHSFTNCKLNKHHNFLTKEIHIESHMYAYVCVRVLTLFIQKLLWLVKFSRRTWCMRTFIFSLIFFTIHVHDLNPACVGWTEKQPRGLWAAKTKHSRDCCPSSIKIALSAFEMHKGWKSVTESHVSRRISRFCLPEDMTNTC